MTSFMTFHHSCLQWARCTVIFILYTKNKSLQFMRIHHTTQKINFNWLDKQINHQFIMIECTKWTNSSKWIIRKTSNEKFYLTNIFPVYFELFFFIVIFLQINDKKHDDGSVYYFLCLSHLHHFYDVNAHQILMFLWF